MNDLNKLIVASTIAATISLSGCGNESSEPAEAAYSEDHGHDHADADADHDHMDDAHGEQEHDEVAIDPLTIDGMIIALAQGHGMIEPGKEMHLVVKLPYSDNGATVVRSWLGTEDRFASVVAKGEYAASHDDYDVHAVAPDPLPENTMWWIEIEKPDGEKLLGSVAPR